jgi:hypothetical protein
MRASVRSETAGEEKLGIGRRIIRNPRGARNAGLSRQIGATDARHARTSGIGDSAEAQLPPEMIFGVARFRCSFCQRKELIALLVERCLQLLRSHLE